MSTSHTLAVLSALPVASLAPSGDHAASKIFPERVEKKGMLKPESGSVRKTRSLKLAMAIREPLGFHCAAAIQLRWAFLLTLCAPAHIGTANTSACRYTGTRIAQTVSATRPV